MGDIADGILNGDFDEQTGEYIGPGDGYPRTMRKNYSSKVSKELFGIKNWLWKTDIANWQNVIQIYAHNILQMPKGTENDVVAKTIQKEFGLFVKWVKENKDELKFK